MERRRNSRGFSLAEVLVAIGVVGVVLSMIMGAVAILDQRVANERLIPFPSSVDDADLVSWGFSKTSADGNPTRPNYVLAPSRIGEVQAQSLWRQMQEMYAGSTEVAVLNGYLLHDFSVPQFIGTAGFLSTDSGEMLTRAKLLSPSDLASELESRFGSSFELWDPPASVDANSYRGVTIVFLAPSDRILGILRVRAFQFISDSTIPYRFYDVNLARLFWEDTNSSGVAAWSLRSGTNFIEDTNYHFVEDRRFPQDLIFPPTDAMRKSLYGLTTSSAASRNLLARLASYQESYSSISSAGVSRRQTTLVESGYGTDTGAPAYEWHLILPDPSCAQAERCAKIIRDNGGAYTSAITSVPHQGKLSCVFKLYP
jgi:prepilin-type N-terminal cleavage/methylation domain-containing protein